MKTFISFPFVLICLGFSVNLFGSHAKSKHFLQFEGKIYQTGMDSRCTRKILDSAFIFIYDKKTKATDTVMTSYSGNYSFRLPLNSEYLITISKKGFVSKRLNANTKVPIFSKGENEMEFELDLFKEVVGIDVSILDKPVADIFFNSKKKSFDYNRAYTEQVNRKLRASYTAYYKKLETPKATVIRTKW